MSTLTGGAPWVDETPKRHKNDHRTGRCGGIGRRDGFKIRSGSPRVWVRVPPPALFRRHFRPGIAFAEFGVSLRPRGVNRAINGGRNRRWHAIGRVPRGRFPG